MEAFQPIIEDERKARLSDLTRQTNIGSLGCGLTMSWADCVIGENRQQNIAHAILPNIFGTDRTSLVLGERKVSVTWGELQTVEILTRNHPSRAQSGARQVADEPGGGTGEPQFVFRGRELEWRRTHASELKRYANQWVVLEGEDVIAHSSDAAQAIRDAKARGIRTPYVFFVESESDDLIRIGL